MYKKIVVLNDKDNVGVLLESAKAGDYCIYKDNRINLFEDIEFGHKIALNDILVDESVYKYGEEIGFTLEDVKKGQWIHNHNMGCRRGK
ncbi:MAG: UxaA family hydrolase [Clostridia bacterium]|nr:UxaA family hydrolase [Clostridia bacterium]